MKNTAEIEREIISAQKELAELDARRSALLGMIKQSQAERDLIDKASASSSKVKAESDDVAKLRGLSKSRKDK